MAHEGVIKYRLEWKKSAPLPETITKRLREMRDILHSYGLIGVGKDGIGYGNVSTRIGGAFIITGSQTGHLERLGGEHIALVTSSDIRKNHVACEGPVKASSEAMTHGAIYEAIPLAFAVIHVHSPVLWGRFIDRLPTTSKDAAYGSPELAEEVMRLYQDTDLRLLRAMVIGGHKDGLFFYGHSTDEALETALDYANSAGIHRVR